MYSVFSMDYSECVTCGTDLFCEEDLGTAFPPISTLSELECKAYCSFLNLWTDDFSDYYEEYSGGEMTGRRLRCENYVWFDSR